MAFRIRAPSAGFSRFAALVILIGCILPQVTYLGHWPVPGVTSAIAESDEHEAAAAPGQPAEDPEGEGGIEHELHCHTGPSKCGGPQAMVGSVWVGEDAGLLGLDNAPHAESGAGTLSRRDPFLTPILPPPRALA